MKKIILTVVCLALTAPLFATAEQRVRDLREKQEALANELQTRREKMLRENGELLELQEEKRRINRKMVIIMESDPDFFELSRRYAELDIELRQMTATLDSSSK